MSLLQKTLTLIACSLVGFVCGTLYLFSAFGPQLASQLKYTGSQSSLVAFAGTIGISLSGVPAALVIDHKGLTISVVIGALCLSSGYIGLKDQYDRSYSSLPISVTLMFLVGAGSTFINTATIQCCAVTFPNNRGVATSFPISTYGLSAFIYSFLGSMFFQNNTSGFLGFLGYSSLTVSALTLPFIYFADKATNKGQTSRNLFPSRSGTQSPAIELDSISSPSFPKQRHISDDLIHRITQSHTLTKIGVLKTGMFWKIFIIIGVFVGLGQLYIYSVGFMLTALLHGSDTDTEGEQQYQVSVISIANCAGRLLCGVLGDFIANSLHKPRSWVLLVPSITLFTVQILGFNVSSEKQLWILSVLNGLGYGFTWSSAPQTLIELFGVHNFSFSWGIVNLAPIIPAYVFTQLFGSNYDSNMTIDEETGANICLKGRDCYDHTYELTTIAAFLAVLLVAWTTLKPLLARAKAHYSDV